MMLVYIVVFVVIVYVVLDRSGILADLADTFRDTGAAGHPELGEEPITDPDTNRRLEIFEDFIERLDQDDPESESDEHG